MYSWIDKDIGYCQGELSKQMFFCYSSLVKGTMFYHVSSLNVKLFEFSKSPYAGMSDLCSPMSIILEHEADAFWCFERLMRRVVSTLAHLIFHLTKTDP